MKPERSRDDTKWPRLRRIVLMMLLLPAVVGLVVLANNWKTQLRVHEITVSGNVLFSAERLIRLSGVTEGQLLDGVDLYAVRERLLTGAYLREVSVKREMPDRIAIDVVERTPVCILFADQPLFLDREGFVVPASNAVGFFDLPVISGSIPRQDLKAGKQIASPAVREVLKVAAALQSVGELDARISEYQIGRKGDVMLFTAEGGIPVLLGKEISDEKLASFVAFWKQVVLKKSVGQLEFVDIRFDHQIVAKWRKV